MAEGKGACAVTSAGARRRVDPMDCSSAQCNLTGGGAAGAYFQFAFMIGVLPLVASTGAGCVRRIATYFVPMFFILVQSRIARVPRRRNFPNGKAR
jgi:hypothetical protein